MNNVQPKAKQEFMIFLVVGCLAVLIDYLSYLGILWLSFTQLPTAKGISFLIGTAFAYFANRFWTFGHSDYTSASIWRFVLLYSITMMINVAVNSTGLFLLNGFSWGFHLAYLLATGVSAMLNFLGMKYFVFTNQPSVITS